MRRPGAASNGGRTAAPAGQSFAQPQELRSANGVLRVTLTAEEREVTIAGETVRGRVYNGSFVAPTLRLQPGDRLEVTLVNKLAQMTNLHTHGFHVSPQANSDNVFRMVDPGATATYVYELSNDCSPGTYWYHPHMHGEVESQIFGGMSGVILVEGLPRYLPAGLRDVEERTISLKDFQHKDGAIPASNINSDAPTTRVVNGLREPAMTIRPGETQLWRLANIGADLPVDFAPVDDLAAATVDRRRTLVFTEEDKANKFFIDGKQFDPNRIDQLVGLNGVEEWTIRNQTSELHPFHIHVNDFQVQSVNRRPFQARSWADVVPLPIKARWWWSACASGTSPAGTSTTATSSPTRTSA
jgi:FtsP/CotA-like multicopper oxidase with cupredoxin domain